MPRPARTVRREGSDPLRRRRHPPASDHPHQRQAAGAGGQQADPVLRHRGHGRGRDHRDRHHRRRHRRRDHGGGRRRLPFGASRSPTSPRTRRSGLAHCVLIARDFLGDDDFVMYLGDNMLQQGLAEFVDAFEADRPRGREPDPRRRRPSPAAQILLAQVADPQRFGVAEIDADGEVVRLVEKPERPAVRPGAGRRLPVRPRASTRPCAAIEPSPRGELEITDAIQWLIDHGHRVAPRGARRLVDRHRQEGPAAREQPPACSRRSSPRSTATVDDASRIEGRVVIEAGAEIVNSHVRGPAIIGAGTRVVNSYVGPFTVDRRRLRDRRLRDRALGGARAQPHRRRAAASPTRSSAATSRSPRSGQRPRAHPPDARRPLARSTSSRQEHPMATVTESDVIAGVVRRRARRSTATSAASSSRPTAASGSRRAAR